MAAENGIDPQLLREKLAHIDLMLSQNNLSHTHMDLMLAQSNRVRQEIAFAPWLAVISGVTAGAAIFAAAFAFARLF